MCTFLPLDGLFHSVRMVLLLKMHPLLFLQTFYITRIQIYPCPLMKGGFLAQLRIYGLSATYQLLYCTQYQNQRTDTVYFWLKILTNPL